MQSVSIPREEGNSLPDEVKPKTFELPVLEFPPRLYDTGDLVLGLEEVQDDFRAFLLERLKQHDTGWQRLPDRDIVMCDFALTVLAPFMVELIAPRVGSIRKAEDVLAKRFSNWGGGGKASMQWANGWDDINEWDDGLTALFGNIVLARKLHAVPPE